MYVNAIVIIMHLEACFIDVSICLPRVVMDQLPNLFHASYFNRCTSMMHTEHILILVTIQRRYALPSTFYHPRIGSLFFLNEHQHELRVVNRSKC